MDNMIDEILDQFMTPIHEHIPDVMAGMTLYAKLQNIVYDTSNKYIQEHIVHPEFLHNRSDTVSVWRCKCGHAFTTSHEPGVLNGTDVNFCSKCGDKFMWYQEGSEIKE